MFPAGVLRCHPLVSVAGYDITPQANTTVCEGLVKASTDTPSKPSPALNSGNPPKLKTKRAQSWISTALANAYSLSGQPARGIPLFQICARLDEGENDKRNLAIDLGNLASMAQIYIGALGEAERNLRRAIQLDKESESGYDEACD